MPRSGLIILAWIACVLVACKETSLRDYESRVESLEPPIAVTRLVKYGRSTGFTVRDRSGRSVSFCVQSIPADDPSRDLNFGIGLMHVGGLDWQKDRTLGVPPNSSLEDRLLDLMREWVLVRFPTWADPDSVPHSWTRGTGSVGDSSAAIRFLGAIQLIEMRRSVLAHARYPGDRIDLFESRGDSLRPGVRDPEPLPH